MQQEIRPQPPSKGTAPYKLTRGMSEEDKTKFDGAYLRSKRVVQRLNEYVEREAHQGLKAIDDPRTFETGADWPYLAAWHSGFRYAMRSVSELTRT